MTNRQIAPVILRLSTVVIVFGSIACANPPIGPTPVPAPASQSTRAAVTGDAATPATLSQCLGGSAEPSCFSGARVHAMSEESARDTSAPVLNNNQPVLNSGPTVTLFWTPPAGGLTIGYIIEASSTPEGAPDLANFNTLNASTTLVVPDVPPGAYYVRVHALGLTGVSAPSNEVQVVVTSGDRGPCPSAPRALNLASQSYRCHARSTSPASSGRLMVTRPCRSKR